MMATKTHNESTNGVGEVSTIDTNPEIEDNTSPENGGGSLSSPEEVPTTTEANATNQRASPNDGHTHDTCSRGSCSDGDTTVARNLPNPASPYPDSPPVDGNLGVGAGYKSKMAAERAIPAEESMEDEGPTFAYPTALCSTQLSDNFSENNASSLAENGTRGVYSTSSSGGDVSPPLPSIADDEDVKGLLNIVEEDSGEQQVTPAHRSTNMSHYNGRMGFGDDMMSPTRHHHESSLNESLSNKRGYYKTYTREQLMKALEAVQTAKMSGEQAAKFFKVPRSTLHHHLRPMQYWCVYCQKDLRYKIEWKEHMATHKKKGSHNKTPKANHNNTNNKHSIETGNQMVKENVTTMVNGGTHYEPQENDPSALAISQSAQWTADSNLEDLANIATNGYSQGSKKGYSCKNEPKTAGYYDVHHASPGSCVASGLTQDPVTSSSSGSGSYQVAQPETGDDKVTPSHHSVTKNTAGTWSRNNRTSKGTTGSYGGNVGPTTSVMNHRSSGKQISQASNTRPTHVHGYADTFRDYEAKPSPHVMTSQEPGQSTLTPPSSGMLYQGLANGTVPSLTDYLTGLSRACPPGMDAMKYLSEYYYRNYRQQYEALSNRLKPTAASYPPSHGYGDKDKFGRDLSDHTVDNVTLKERLTTTSSTNVFPCDTLRDYLLQGKNTTAHSTSYINKSGYDKNNEVGNVRDTKTYSSDKKGPDIRDNNYKQEINSRYSNTASSSPNLPLHEVRKMIMKNQDVQTNSLNNAEFICALCGITSSNKAQFMNHLFLHNQIFLVSNVNGISGGFGSAKPSLRDLNLALQKTATDITQRLDNMYGGNDTNGSWASFLGDASRDYVRSKTNSKHNGVDEWGSSSIQANNEGKGIIKSTLVSDPTKGAKDSPRTPDTYSLAHLYPGAKGVAAYFGMTEGDLLRNYPHWFSGGLNPNFLDKVKVLEELSGNGRSSTEYKSDQNGRVEANNIPTNKRSWLNCQSIFGEKTNQREAEEAGEARSDNFGTKTEPIKGNIRYPVVDTHPGISPYAYGSAKNFNDQVQLNTRPSNGENSKISEVDRYHGCETSSRASSEEEQEQSHNGFPDMKNGRDKFDKMSAKDYLYSKGFTNGTAEEDKRDNLTPETDFTDLVKRLSTLYQDPNSKANLNMEALKYKFMQHFANKQTPPNFPNLPSDNTAHKSPEKIVTPPEVTQNVIPSVSKRKAKFPLRLGSKQFCS